MDIVGIFISPFFFGIKKLNSSFDTPPVYTNKSKSKLIFSKACFILSLSISLSYY